MGKVGFGCGFGINFEITAAVFRMQCVPPQLSPSTIFMESLFHGGCQNWRRQLLLILKAVVQNTDFSCILTSVTAAGSYNQMMAAEFCHLTCQDALKSVFRTTAFNTINAFANKDGTGPRRSYLTSPKSILLGDQGLF
jgi:hypothetical protein